ncbi:MAG: hypothetical protein IJS32_07535 [Kiritimatiellae bacterium]|nr:hypothetical protein [Kiritimatiellia bacterium]
MVCLFGTTIFSLELKSMLGEWDWRAFLECAVWPRRLLGYLGINPWLWLALAAGLLYLFARQFWRPGLRPALLAAAAVALWWLAALFLLWGSVTASC